MPTSVYVDLGGDHSEDRVVRQNPKLCPQFARGFKAPGAGPQGTQSVRWFHQAVDPKFGDQYTRPKTITCPECGRRVTPAVSFCHDGCCMYLCLPVHKRKAWWRKARPRRRA